MAESDAPLLDAGKVFLGPYSTTIMLTAVFMAIGTSINGIFLFFGRYLFAMGRENVLPQSLSRIHPKWGTPHIAIITAYVLCLIGLLMSSSLVFLFLAVNIPTMLKYLGTCLAATRLPDKWNDLYERAGFRLSQAWTKIWGYLGVLCAALIIIAGFSADWKPYVLLLAWGVIGTLYWRITGNNRTRNNNDGQIGGSQ